MIIPESEIKYSDYSMLDAFGRVFFWNDKVYRGLTIEGREAFYRLKEIGLLAELEQKSLIPTSSVTNYNTQYFDVVIEHEKIAPASFVYEWPFDMVKAAGECILNVNLIAAKYNYQTIDAHPYNVLFKGCQPLFIDLGSLIAVENATGWNALEEFYGYFKYPLRIWNDISYPMARRLYDEDLSFISSDDYNRLINLSTPSYVKKIRALKQKISGRVTNKVSKTLIEKLETYKSDLKVLTRNKITTQWGNYHDDYIIDDKISGSDRFKTIISKIAEFKIETITELAGNWGLLSYLLLEHTGVKHINCTDYDENAVNKMYNYFKDTKYAQQLSPALIDFMKPVELCNSGRPAERFKSEAVFALAVTHHLVLTNKYDLSVILKKIGEYSSKYIFVEFMPLGLWNGEAAPELPGFYNQDWFTKKFEEQFSILDIAHIEENRILYTGIKKLPV